MMALTMFIFAVQDGVSQYLAREYNVVMIVMVRYWFFAFFVVALALRQSAGLATALRSKRPWLQAFRGVLLAAEVCVMVLAFTLLGVIESHAIFASVPLLVAALSGPVLGEHVGWRRWSAIGLGFIGMMIILQPGVAVFSPYALIGVCAAVMFALYSLLTRYVSRHDTTLTSAVWTGLAGAAFMTVVGIWFWEPMASKDWGWMAALCLMAAVGHYMLIKCYELAEAGVLQPFAYLQLVFVTLIGVTILGETVETNVIIGGLIVTSAGIFTLIRARQVSA